MVVKTIEEDDMGGIIRGLDGIQKYLKHGRPHVGGSSRLEAQYGIVKK